MMHENKHSNLFLKIAVLKIALIQVPFKVKYAFHQDGVLRYFLKLPQLLSPRKPLEVGFCFQQKHSPILFTPDNRNCFTKKILHSNHLTT